MAAASPPPSAAQRPVSGTASATASANALGTALARLDLLIHREILRMRATYELSLDEFRGLYVSDEQVDALVTRGLHEHGVSDGIDALTARAAALRREARRMRAPDEPLARVASELALTPFEEDVVLVALAPELDLKYETLYAYLNNDVSRRWPTRDVALRLLAEQDRWTARRFLLPEAPLFASGVLREIEPAGEAPARLGAGFAASPVLVRFALGLPFSEAAARRVDDAEMAVSEVTMGSRRDELHRVAHLWADAAEPPVLVLEGERGSGRGAAAAVVCRALGLNLLRLDPSLSRAGAESALASLRATALQQRLEPAGVYFAIAEGTLADARASADLRAVVELLGRRGGPLIVAGPPGTPWREVLGARGSATLHLAPPDGKERRWLWAAFLNARGSGAAAEVVGALADRFALSAVQINRAVVGAHTAHRLAGGAGEPPTEALFRAAREESGQPLDGLAARVPTMHGWNDLVLPPATMRRVREVAAAVRLRHTVYGTWGFDRRMGPAQGLRALFTGGSGTGKTMTAGVIARELGLDLYKVDLSGVVSKYIGETEKNLDRIFRAARVGNAVLFFDEADALFGKRSEVRDSHDRYANIEVAYLLQRVEEHDGVVILATNLRRNIDEAFARRMQFVIDFPQPDEAQRELLWRGMFPAGVPIDDAVDFRFLARQFPLAGGDIRNVALDAAFLAAQDGGRLAMKHLVQALGRQILKQGKIPSTSEFRQYHALLGGSD